MSQPFATVANRTGLAGGAAPPAGTPGPESGVVCRVARLVCLSETFGRKQVLNRQKVGLSRASHAPERRSPEWVRPSGCLSPGLGRAGSAKGLAIAIAPQFRRVNGAPVAAGSRPGSRARPLGPAQTGFVISPRESPPPLLRLKAAPLSPPAG